MRFFLIFIQLIFLLILFSWVISLDHQIDFFWKGIIFTSKLSNVFLVIIFFIFVILFIYRIYLFFKQTPKRIKNSLIIKNYNKGINAIVSAIVAMSNNDDKELIFQSKKIENYLNKNPISLILKAESARKAKKNELAEQYFNEMLKNSQTKIIGLRGLLEQNLKKQDYHHALIYAEDIYNINPKLEWIYKTIRIIIIKTKNWQKLLAIDKDAFNRNIITKKIQLNNSSIAKYEIALIKEDFSIQEAIKLLTEANLSRPNFPPIVKKLSRLLIDNNQLTKAKKLIQKCWVQNPHQMFFEELISISKIENVNIVKIISKLIKDNSNNYDSIILIVKANINEKEWDRAKELIKPLLSSKPNKTICELMYQIEIGIYNNIQKANSWKSRIPLGDLEKAWVCKYSGSVQDHWTGISKEGFLDSLEWTWPRNEESNKKDNLIPNIIG